MGFYELVSFDYGASHTKPPPTQKPPSGFFNSERVSRGTSVATFVAVFPVTLSMYAMS
jgi:hypothetical protein